ncbi:MAG: hypothetical protein ACD_16C00190G0001 [uncultured bacterium]|nr:MAG: hypothetical protein ACD_16C00190G0001 [uncultured bacterium]
MKGERKKPQNSVSTLIKQQQNRVGGVTQTGVLLRRVISSHENCFTP